MWIVVDEEQCSGVSFEAPCSVYATEFLTWLPYMLVYGNPPAIVLYQLQRIILLVTPKEPVVAAVGSVILELF